ncbi:MAG: hypothetical protein M3159_06615, partial [Actinomycetota bacterium]|nr:hypothetical protein [Actinomycetota bacterium]
AGTRHPTDGLRRRPRPSLSQRDRPPRAARPGGRDPTGSGHRGRPERQSNAGAKRRRHRVSSARAGVGGEKGGTGHVDLRRGQPPTRRLHRQALPVDIGAGAA